MKILVTEPEYFTKESLALMRTVGSVTSRRMSRRDLLKNIPQFDVVVVRIETRLDKELLIKAKKLQCVITATTGINHVDTAYLRSHNIPLFSLHGTHSVPTAEHALALLFAAARNIPKAHASLVRGRWNRWEHIGRQLTGKTLGIYGIGRIGTELAKRAQALGMEVIAFDPYVSKAKTKQRDARKTTWPTFIATSDFFSIHAPLTKETKEAFGKSEFKKMKPGAILVNAARGEIVNEKALLSALGKNQIAGAALDVYPEEPLSPKSALIRYARTHTNLILTPHIAASTREAVEHASLASAQALIDFVASRRKDRRN